MVVDVYVSLSDVLLNDVITHGALTAGAVRVDCCDISAKSRHQNVLANIVHLMDSCRGDKEIPSPKKG